MINVTKSNSEQLVQCTQITEQKNNQTNNQIVVSIKCDNLLNLRKTIELQQLRCNNCTVFRIGLDFIYILSVDWLKRIGLE